MHYGAVPSFGLLLLRMHVSRIIYSAFSIATGKLFCVAPHGYSRCPEFQLRCYTMSKI